MRLKCSFYIVTGKYNSKLQYVISPTLKLCNMICVPIWKFYHMIFLPIWNFYYIIFVPTRKLKHIIFHPTWKFYYVIFLPRKIYYVVKLCCCRNFTYIVKIPLRWSFNYGVGTFITLDKLLKELSLNNIFFSFEEML